MSKVSKNGRVLEGETVDDHVEMGIGEYFWRVAERYGERIFQIDGSTGQTESFSQVKNRAVKVALQLQKMGVSKNDVVMLCDNVNMDNIIPIIALWLLGAIPAPIYGCWDDYYITHAVKNIKPKVIISHEDKLSTFTKTYDTIGKPEPPICSTKTLMHVSLEKTEAEQTFKPVKVDPQNVGFIAFSSGTTAIPKAICIPHFSPLSGPCRRNRDNNLVWDKPLIRQNYFHWISTLWALMYNIIFAQPCLLISSSIIEVLRGIEKYKIEDLPLIQQSVNDLLSLDQKTIQKFDLTSVRNIIYGASRISPQDIPKVEKIFKNENTLITYASTEIGAIATVNHIADKGQIKKLDSCGQPTQNVKVKIVNPDTEETLGPKEEGEIRVKSPYRMLGIKDNTEKTEQLFDSEGFLKTNDFGYFDEDGDLYVLGRMSNTFKHRGRFYHAENVQDVLKNHPAVEDAVILGIENGTTLSQPAACIKLRKGQHASKKELSDHVAKEMSEFYRPVAGIQFFDHFPMTSSQKVSLMELKKLFVDIQESVA